MATLARQNKKKMGKSVFEKQETLTLFDVDCFDRWKLSSVSEKMLLTADLHCFRYGWEWDRLYHELGICLVLTRQHIEMTDYPGVQTEVLIKTWADPDPKTLINRYFTFETKDGRIGQALTQCVLIDVRSRSIVHAADYGLVIEPHEQMPPENSCRINKVIASKYDTEHPLFCGSRKVLYGNLDYNGHMNTAQYVHFAEDFLGRDFFAQRVPTEVDFRYNYEVQYGETVFLTAAEKKDGTPGDLYLAGASAEGESKTVYFEAVMKSVARN